LPLLNGFIGEFTICRGRLKPTGVGGLRRHGRGVGAAYLLWLYQRTMLGQVTNAKNLDFPI